jgi:hypothetical protein
MSLRPAVLAVVALTAASGIGLALYRWSARGNGDLLALAWAVQHNEELESRVEGVRRRYQAKRALAAEVVAGRMSLREAAGHFRRLEEADPDYPPDSPRPPGDEQALCVQVLYFLGEILGEQGRYAAAARWYAEAFAAHPQLLAGPPTGHRYQAACASARAGCGQGRDAADLDATSRAGLRRQAFDWLRAALEARRRLLKQGPQIARSTVALDMEIWLKDPGFAGVRGTEALARLPEAERQAWQKLWGEVTDTLAWAWGRIPPEPRAGSKVPLPEW